MSRINVASRTRAATRVSKQRWIDASTEAESQPHFVIANANIHHETRISFTSERSIGRPIVVHVQAAWSAAQYWANWQQGDILTTCLSQIFLASGSADACQEHRRDQANRPTTKTDEHRNNTALKTQNCRDLKRALFGSNLAVSQQRQTRVDRSERFIGLQQQI